MHEQSQTIQLPNKRWVNVIGGTHKVLVPQYPFEAQSYPNLRNALFAAVHRSYWEGRMDPFQLDPLNQFLAAAKRRNLNRHG